MNSEPANLTFEIRVKPGSKSSSVGGTYGDSNALNVAVQSPAHDGQANEAVVDLLATVLQVRKRQITITRGLTHRTKVIEVSDATDNTRGRLEFWKAKS